jgi:hypothetical protein
MVAKCVNQNSGFEEFGLDFEGENSCADTLVRFLRLGQRNSAPVPVGTGAELRTAWRDLLRGLLMGRFPRYVHSPPGTPNTQPRLIHAQPAEGAARAGAGAGAVAGRGARDLLAGQAPGDAKKLRDFVEILAASDDELEIDLFVLLNASSGCNRTEMGLNVPDVQKILRHFHVDATGKGDVVRSRLDTLLTSIILQQDPIMQQWIKEEELEDCVSEYCPRWTP